MFKGLRGRYESKPLKLITKEEAIAFAAGNPCSQCGQPIDAKRQDYAVVNDSRLGISAHHHGCREEL